ncbi:MAG TPA: polynucleotide adenylyltransferase [Verrucomicrobiae bacterium]
MGEAGKGNFTLPEELERILLETDALQEAYLVGGCVRDWFLGSAQKDFDIEVFGITYEQLEKALRKWGRVDLVGRSFGVVKLTMRSGATYDFSLPRRDSKIAAGHRGFTITFDPDITPKEAAARRDYTINALMYSPRKGALLDHYGGVADLKQRVLRHTSEAFTEDPLRVLRGMQFAARFNLTVAPETVKLCRSIKDTYRELAVERVREEWFKWASKSVTPSRGLHFLRDTGWIEHFPEVLALIDVPQEPEWHPEGDVYTHTSLCCDAMARLSLWQQKDETSRIVYMLAILAHDFAKPQTTSRALRDGVWRIVSPGHEEAGGPIAERFLERIAAPNAIRERIIPLVVNHLAHLNAASARGVRRLAKRLVPETIEGLCLVIEADHSGRPPKPPGLPKGGQMLLEMAEEMNLKASAPKPILLGRDLIAKGMSPGKQFGAILEAAFEAQLEGKFTDHAGALQWLEETLRAE